MIWDKIIDGVRGEMKTRRDRGKELSVTSLPHLDHSIWGIQKGKLHIIGARPSQGKSALIRQITLDLIRGRKYTMLFSWEETREQLIQNMASLNGLAKNFDMVTGNINESHEKALEGLKPILSGNHLMVLEKRGKTVDDFIRLVEKPNKLDCVIVDYIQLMSTKGQGNAKEAYDEFLKTARDLAKDRYCYMKDRPVKEKQPCAVVIASQINRATIQNKQVTPPMMNELKGSGVLEEHADVVLLLHYPWSYDRSGKEYGEHDYLIIIAKNKNTGRTFLHKCYFYVDYFKVSEVPLESEHTYWSKDEKKT